MDFDVFRLARRDLSLGFRDSRHENGYRRTPKRKQRYSFRRISPSRSSNSISLSLFSLSLPYRVYRYVRSSHSPQRTEWRPLSARHLLRRSWRTFLASPARLRPTSPRRSRSPPVFTRFQKKTMNHAIILALQQRKNSL